MSSQTEKTQDNETKKEGNKDSRLWESIKFGLSIFAIIAGIYVYVTEDNVPKCSDKRVLSTLKDILKEFDKKQFTMIGLDADVSKIKYDFSLIRTTAENEQTGAYDCNAQVNIKGLKTLLGEPSDNDIVKVDVEYKVSNTDDNSNFIVEVSKYE